LNHSVGPPGRFRIHPRRRLEIADFAGRAMLVKRRIEAGDLGDSADAVEQVSPRRFPIVSTGLKTPIPVMTTRRAGSEARRPSGS
jgi:hypothetical protein